MRVGVSEVGCEVAGGGFACGCCGDSAGDGVNCGDDFLQGLGPPVAERGDLARCGVFGEGGYEGGPGPGQVGLVVGASPGVYRGICRPFGHIDCAVCHAAQGLRGQVALLGGGRCGVRGDLPEHAGCVMVS